MAQGALSMSRRPGLKPAFPTDTVSLGKVI